MCQRGRRRATLGPWDACGCGVVVDDQTDVELVRHSLDMVQEGEELLVTIAGLALGDDRTVEHVEGGEQGGGAVTLVVVGDAFDVAAPMGSRGEVLSRACLGLF